jgi:hypothetical protein
MCSLPLWINNRTLSDFNDAVTRGEADFPGCIYQLDVGPLIPMMVDVIGDLAKQHALRLQDSIRFSHEWRECVRERVAVLLG